MCKIPKVLQDSLQYFEVTSLESSTSVSINLPTETLHYKISAGSSIYYLYNTQGDNGRIFDILDIRNKHSFIHNIVGYDTTGCFPELKSEEDLLKVIIALDKECIRKFGNKHIQSSEPESKSESKSTSELNLFPTRKHYQLNFSY